MVKMYHSKQKDIMEAVKETLRRETGKTIFTLRVLKEPNKDENFLEVLVVFTDETILISRFVAFTTDNQLVLRMQGNYI
jgi:tRNA U54 and U55 pseudouridine synthase Pus10